MIICGATAVERRKVAWKDRGRKASAWEFNGHLRQLPGIVLRWWHPSDCAAGCPPCQTLAMYAPCGLHSRLRSYPPISNAGIDPGHSEQDDINTLLTLYISSECGNELFLTFESSSIPHEYPGAHRWRLLPAPAPAGAHQPRSPSRRRALWAICGNLQ